MTIVPIDRETREHLKNAATVWFIGPITGPGYYLMKSDRPNHSVRSKGDGSGHRPPDFPWKSMDRRWHVPGPQGTAAMNWRTGWSVLSISDLTEDSRPNVMCVFAIQYANLHIEEMKYIVMSRFHDIWYRFMKSGLKDITPIQEDRNQEQ